MHIFPHWKEPLQSGDLSGPAVTPVLDWAFPGASQHSCCEPVEVLEIGIRLLWIYLYPLKISTYFYFNFKQENKLKKEYSVLRSLVININFYKKKKNPNPLFWNIILLTLGKMPWAVLDQGWKLPPARCKLKFNSYSFADSISASIRQTVKNCLASSTSSGIAFLFFSFEVYQKAKLPSQH